MLSTFVIIESIAKIYQQLVKKTLLPVVVWAYITLLQWNTESKKKFFTLQVYITKALRDEKCKLIFKILEIPNKMVKSKLATLCLLKLAFMAANNTRIKR